MRYAGRCGPVPLPGHHARRRRRHRRAGGLGQRQRANRSPAAASYLRAPGDGAFRAFKIDVLRCAEGRIAELTTFNAELFDAFGLPPILAVD
jgi:hypothetical protein